MKHTENKKKRININSEEEVEVLLYARLISTYVQAIINLLNPRAVCIERSSLIGHALILIGIPAEIVIGRQTATKAASNNYEFHAWVEVYNTPINDSVSINSYFEEIERFS